MKLVIYRLGISPFFFILKYYKEVKKIEFYKYFEPYLSFYT